LKKLAIVGTGSETRGNAPFEDASFDIWVLNEAANSQWCKRWSACFQMHEPEIYTGHNTKDPQHWEWLQQSHGKPIYMQEHDERVPDSVRFPLEDAITLAGFQYFSSTLAMMCALAILQRYEYVEFYGFEFSVTEYQSQREGFNFWIGFLKGRLGAENVHPKLTHLGKDIFESPLYGYDGNFAFGVEYFQERTRALENEWHAAERSAKNIHRAIERAIEHKEYDKVTQLTTSFQGAMIQSGECAGALAEAERYQAFGDRYADRGGFEFAAAKAQRDGEEKKPFVWHLGGMIEYAWNVWRQSDNPQARTQMIQLIDSMGETAYDMGAMLGMYRENIGYIQKYDAAAQAGGRVLLEAVA
jgi:hypothetical protein